MELLIIIVAIVYLILMIVFFTRLKAISGATSGSLYSHLFVSFLQDSKLRALSRDLKPTKFAEREDGVSFFASNRENIFYYFDFLEFVVSVHNRHTPPLLSLHDHSNFFRPYLLDLKNHPEIMSLMEENKSEYSRLWEYLNNREAAALMR
jgi:hypothetical protein